MTQRALVTRIDAPAPVDESRAREIGWTYVPRIPSGAYSAVSRTAARYFDEQFQRWVCAVQFDVFTDSSLLDKIARLTWFLNLGRGRCPRAGRRSNYWAAWIKANGGPPKRGDRLSPRIFERRCATVRIEDTQKTHNCGKVEPEQAYSVIRDVIEWLTGGGAR